MLTQSTLAFTCHLESGQFLVYRLGENIKTYFAASNSVILALAAFIGWKFPLLPHPNYLSYQIGQLCIEQEFSSSDLSLHPLFEAWSDLLCKSVFDDMAIRVNNILYITIPISYIYTKELQKQGWVSEIYETEIEINKIFNIVYEQKKQKKIILMNLATSQLRQNQLIPKINIPALLLGTIYDNQKWTFYCALKGQIPTYDDLAKADTIILPGSSNSVLDSHQHIDRLAHYLKKAFTQNIKLKVLSICFGHQLISRIYGAKIVRKNRFEGHETVSFNKNLTKKYSFLQKITDHIQQQFMMPEHHQDYVETVPEGFDLVATSKSCFVEAMVKQDGRIFSLQFHPEYFTEYSSAFTARAKMAKVQCHHLSFDLDVEPQKLDAHHQSCIFVRQCIKQFITSQPKVFQQL